MHVDGDAKAVLAAMAERNVLGGLALGDFYPALSDAILVCATETKTDADLEEYERVLKQALEQVGGNA